MNIKHEKAKELRKQAMPEVKKMVAKYGRATINGCLLKLRQSEKVEKKIAELKKEVAQLEKETN